MGPPDTADLRKARGAFFTPEPIAEYLARWAVGGNPDAKVLDPTCGEAVFLLTAGRELRRLGAQPGDMRHQIFGIDVHQGSLDNAYEVLRAEGLDGTLIEADAFAVPTPDQLDAQVPYLDAVLGNPPFVRYQQHIGNARRRSLAAALKQGVRLNGLASSWAALLVHSTAFLKPEGRLAMVVPAELLTVGYAEPIRRWLRQRFSSVHLVLFEELQFNRVEEQVVLLVARGSGGCSAFTLHQVRDSEELESAHIFDASAVAPESAGKWTEMLLPDDSRNLFRRITEDSFSPLLSYASVELGTVTGANSFFTLSEATKQEYGLTVDKHIRRTAPPGTRHIKGIQFTRGHWEQLRLQGERVWMLEPTVSRPTGALSRYLAHGESLKVHEAYKCSIRSPWWRPPVVSAPTYFFTYMSHHAPRLIGNDADVTFVNSMHGVRLRPELDAELRDALPILALNSVTALGAEVFGRSYGGGILKMEPREAAQLPIPTSAILLDAWQSLSNKKDRLDELVRSGQLETAVQEVDRVLLGDALKLSTADIDKIQRSVSRLRGRRQRRSEDDEQGRRVLTV
jgi:adenine-specific DNA methylase